MDKNTSMTETNEPGHSLRQSVKVYVANLMERYEHCKTLDLNKNI